MLINLLPSLISNLHAGRKTKQLGVGSAKRMNYRKIKNEYSRHILNQVVFLHISLNSKFTFKMIRPIRPAMQMPHRNDLQTACKA